MVSTLQPRGIHILLPAAALTVVLSAGPAWGQARLQSRQNGSCPHNGGQASLSSRPQFNALRTAMQNSLRQLKALEQTGQLTAVQLQAVDQMQSTLHNALRQLSTPQFPATGQQPAGPSEQRRTAPLLS